MTEHHKPRDAAAGAGAVVPSATKRFGRNRIIWQALPVCFLALWIVLLLLSSNPVSTNSPSTSPVIYGVAEIPHAVPSASHAVDMPTQNSHQVDSSSPPPDSSLPPPTQPVSPPPPAAKEGDAIPKEDSLKGSQIYGNDLPQSPPDSSLSPPPPPPPPRLVSSLKPPHATKVDTCAGRYIYVHDLPPKFNRDLLRDCNSLNQWTDMCLFTSNAGLGPRLKGYPNGGGVSSSSWYATDQFALDVIFHSRMKNQYPCLTRDSSLASAVFVPFYAGLEIGRNLWRLNASISDATALELMRWLRERPEWGRMGGRDHFFVAGRITWDFRRLNDEVPVWGSSLMVMPEARNMTALVLESSPRHANDVAIPYPTYFHPKSQSEVERWQSRVRKLRRPWLFAFAGGGRPGNSVRGQIIQQCRASKRCKLLDCTGTDRHSSSSCHSAGNVMRLFERSVFCLQPQGDSYTRRSAFDAMVAGCIPVFFHPGSAYVQYQWHLPAQGYGSYSVFIPEDKMTSGRYNQSLNIERVLARIGKHKSAAMREAVIRLIPRLVYADPRVRWGGEVKDAFDAAVDGVLERVAAIRGSQITGTVGGNYPASNTQFDEHNNWKTVIGAANQGPHEWDHFF